MTGPVLELAGVSKAFHDGESELQVLRSVDVRLQAGESLALLGASGSGKSTLLHIASGLERPDQGVVCLCGHELLRLDEPSLAQLRRRDLGFVFQQFNLLPGLSVRDNLLFQRRLNRMDDEDPWVDEVSRALGLDAIGERPVDVLSGGQQQRVAIGRAVAHRPRMVFADEPTGNLHDTLSRQVMTLLMRLVNEAGSTLLLVTHNREMAAYAHRRLRLAEGRLLPAD